MKSIQEPLIKRSKHKTAKIPIGYCYRCGETGHQVRFCKNQNIDNEGNPYDFMDIDDDVRTGSFTSPAMQPLLAAKRQKSLNINPKLISKVFPKLYQIPKPQQTYDTDLSTSALCDESMIKLPVKMINDQPFNTARERPTSIIPNVFKSPITSGQHSLMEYEYKQVSLKSDQYNNQNYEPSISKSQPYRHFYGKITKPSPPNKDSSSPKFQIIFLLILTFTVIVLFVQNLALKDRLKPFLQEEFNVNLFIQKKYDVKELKMKQNYVTLKNDLLTFYLNKQQKADEQYQKQIKMSEEEHDKQIINLGKQYDNRSQQLSVKYENQIKELKIELKNKIEILQESQQSQYSQLVQLQTENNKLKQNNLQLKTKIQQLTPNQILMQQILNEPPKNVNLDQSVLNHWKSLEPISLSTHKFDQCKQVQNIPSVFDDNTYIGQVDSEGNFSGFGRYTWTNKIYEGQFKDGQANGWGRLINKTGVYDGYFKNDQEDGQGTFKSFK